MSSDVRSDESSSFSGLKQSNQKNISKCCSRIWCYVSNFQGLFMFMCTRLCVTINERVYGSSSNVILRKSASKEHEWSPRNLIIPGLTSYTGPSRIFSGDTHALPLSLSLPCPLLPTTTQILPRKSVFQFYLVCSPGSPPPSALCRTCARK